MSTVASLFGFLACVLCAGVCATVALSAFMLDETDEDAPQLRWAGVLFAIIPAVGFGSAAVHIVLNF
jgi:hypothetical protein